MPLVKLTGRLDGSVGHDSVFGVRSEDIYSYTARSEHCHCTVTLSNGEVIECTMSFNDMTAILEASMIVEEE